MGRLTNRLHEKFAWGIAEGLDQQASYLRVQPHVKAATARVNGCKLAKRTDIRERIQQIREEVNCRSLMAIDEKRDLLRQMAEGSVPTKIVRKGDGTVEATFDRLAALLADAKLAGEFAPEKLQVENEKLNLTFELYGRNSRPPKEWLEAEIVEPKVISGSAKAPMDLSMYKVEPRSGTPSLTEVLATPKT